MSKWQDKHTQFVGVHWRPEVVKQIDDIARKENRSRSNAMLTLILQQIEIRNENEKDGRGASLTKHSAINPQPTNTPRLEER